MNPLMGPVSELAKRRFDRKCKRAASGSKHFATARIAVGVLVTSVLIFICLGAEVVRETVITNAAEQKAQAEDGGQSLADENPDYAGWLTVEGTSISTLLSHAGKVTRRASISITASIARHLSPVVLTLQRGPRQQARTCLSTVTTWESGPWRLVNSRIAIERTVFKYRYRDLQGQRWQNLSLYTLVRLKGADEL